MFTKKQVWALLIPLMVEQILTSLMGTADTMMVSNAGSAAISAVALVDSINVLVIFIFSAMATGGSIICAQYIGQKKTKEACEAGRQLLLTVTVLSVASMILCVLFRNVLLQVIFGKVDPEVMENAKIYFLITAFSYPFIGLYNAGAALFRTGGNSRLPMTISTISNGINIAGNAYMIFGLKMGVAGAALATLISRVFCAVVILYFLRMPRQPIVVCDYRKIRPKTALILSIMAMGIPTGIENGMFQFGKLAIQSTISTMTTAEIAAQAMTAMLEQMTSFASIGIGLGMMTIVGQCIGAGKYDEAKKYVIRLTAYGEVGIIVSCLIVGMLVKQVTILGGMEPVAADLTVQLVHFVFLIKPFPWVFSFMLAYGMRAAGDVRYCMAVSSATMWIFRVFIVVVLIRMFHMGPIAVWIGMISDWIVRGIFFTWRFVSGRWMQQKVL